MFIFVQVCRVIDKVFNSSIGFGITNESIGIYKKKACVARMKTESEDKERLKLSTRSWCHQRVWRTIWSWSSSESEDWKLKFVKSCYSEWIWLQKEWKPGATTISEEFEGIGCLSTEECRTKDIVQLYNHYLLYSTPHVCSSTR